MMVNKISFNLSEEIYTSLMRVYCLKDEPINIGVCGCGCVGCGDTLVHVEETEHFVIWYDFMHDLKHVEPGQIFVFNREQYYNETDKILQWSENKRIAHYIGNVFTVWADDFRLNILADKLDSQCVLRSDFNNDVYSGQEEVLQALKCKLLVGSYEEKEVKNYLYRLIDYKSDMETKGYNKCYLEMCHHESPHDVVMYVVFRMGKDEKVSEILLSKNEEWFRPVHWASK